MLSSINLSYGERALRAAGDEPSAVKASLLIAVMAESKSF